MDRPAASRASAISTLSGLCAFFIFDVSAAAGRFGQKMLLRLASRAHQERRWRYCRALIFIILAMMRRDEILRCAAHDAYTADSGAWLARRVAAAGCRLKVGENVGFSVTYVRCHWRGDFAATSAGLPAHASCHGRQESMLMARRRCIGRCKGTTLGFFADAGH